MATHTLDLAAFRLLFPAFADDTKFPDAVIQAQWNAATAIMTDQDNWALCGDKLQTALDYLAAHLMQLNALASSGGGGGIVKSSTVDKVSVTLEAPPAKSQWAWWLNQTPYGATLLALLGIAGAGGFYVGGLPEQAAFRTVGGGFGRFGFR